MGSTDNLELTDEEIALLLDAIGNKIQSIEDDRYSKNDVAELRRLSKKLRTFRRARRRAREEEECAGTATGE